MIKIKLYYSIVTILFLISCVSNKGNDFLSIPAKPIYGSYYDKEIMSNELVAFSSLDCGKFLWFNVVNFLVNLFVRF